MKTQSLINILILLLLGITGCNSRYQTYKVFYNPEWYIYQFSRKGLTSEEIKIATNYLETKFNANECYQSLTISSGMGNMENKIFQKLASHTTNNYQDLVEVSPSKVVNMNSLVYAADIKAKNLEHVYRMGAGEGWKDKNIVVKNFLSGCQYPRDIVAGDIIEGPSGERYIVDVIGFKKID